MAKVSKANKTLSLGDELTDFSASLVSGRIFEPMLREILAGDAGRWHLVSDWLEPLAELDARLDVLQDEAHDELLIGWMLYPDGEADGFCSVIFRMDEINWSLFALYNRARLMQDNEPK